MAIEKRQVFSIIFLRTKNVERWCKIFSHRLHHFNRISCSEMNNSLNLITFWDGMFKIGKDVYTFQST